MPNNYSVFSKSYMEVVKNNNRFYFKPLPPKIWPFSVNSWPLLSSYWKMTELELTLPIFDVNSKKEIDSINKFIICCSPRSGSFLLTRLLINAGIGLPHEYLNPLHRIEFECRYGINNSNLNDYLWYLMKNRTTSNNCWGIKLHWKQYENSGIGFNNLNSNLILDEVKFIHLYRQDILRQAISLHLAKITGVWGNHGLQTSMKLEINIFDMENLNSCVLELQNAQKQWMDLFTINKVEPLIIKYEELILFQRDHVNAIGEYLGLDPSMWRPTQEDEPNEKMRPISELTLKLEEMYLAKYGIVKSLKF